MPDEPLLIRSFRVVFDLERRIHRIDRFRVPLPYGLPLRSLGYAVGALVLILLLRNLPVLGPLLDEVPAPVRLVLVPSVAAYAFTQLRVDGRPAHAAALAWLRFLVAPRRVAACRAPSRATHVRLAEFCLAPDEQCAGYRRARVIGPAVLLLRYPARARQRGATLVVNAVGDRPMWRGKRIVVRAGQRVVFR